MSLFERVRDIIASLTGIYRDDITREKTLHELNMDSLDIEELKLTIEEEFGILFVNDSSINDVDDILTYIAANA